MLVQIRGFNSTMIHSSPKLVKNINTGDHYKPLSHLQKCQNSHTRPSSVSLSNSLTSAAMGRLHW